MSEKKKQYIAPIAKVRGLGAAHSGVHHWWAQRLSAVALIPLTLWFIPSLLLTMQGGQEAITAWFASPYVSLTLAAMMVAAFHHAWLGLQVVIEDYVHCHCVQIASLVAVKAVSLGGIALSLMAIAKLHFGA